MSTVPVLIILAAVLVASGCNGTSARSHEAPPLRVSAGLGLTELRPVVAPSGSTAAALNLVYPNLRPGARVVTRRGEVVTIEVPTRSSTTAAVAASLRFPGLLSSRAIGERVEMRFRDVAAATAFVNSDVWFSDSGPFRVAEQSADRIVLTARQAQVRFDRMHIFSMPVGTQWRRLLARDIDVIPLAPALQMRELMDVSSVRLVRYQHDHGVLLTFDTARAKERAFRHAVAAAIDATAVATVVCGAADCALPTVQPAAPAGLKGEAPDQVRLLVLNTDSTALATADVLRLQLLRAGIQLDVVAVGIDEIGRLAMTHAADLFVQYTLLGPDFWDCFRTGGRRNVSGYANSEYDAAVDRGDHAAARRILSRDLPGIPLFEARHFAAIDSRWCGGAPDQITSWLWLADLYPCEAGSR